MKCPFCHEGLYYYNSEEYFCNKESCYSKFHITTYSKNIFFDFEFKNEYGNFYLKCCGPNKDLGHEKGYVSLFRDMKYVGGFPFYIEFDFNIMNESTNKIIKRILTLNTFK